MKRVLVRALLVAGVLAAAGCRPTFPEDAALDVTETEWALVVSWPAASPETEEVPVAGYQITVAGGPVLTASPWASSCQLEGIEADQTYEITIVAVDEQGRGSGPLTTSFTPSVSRPGENGPECLEIGIG